VEISEHDFLGWVDRVAEGYRVLSEDSHRYHVSGFADCRGTHFRTPYMQEQELGRQLEPQIEDGELRNAFHVLGECAQQAVEVDGQIVEWLAGFVGMPSPRNRRGGERLEQRLDEIASGGDEGPVGPVWIPERGYQVLVKRSAEVAHAAAEAYLPVHRRIQQLLQHVDKNPLSMSEQVGS